MKRQNGVTLIELLIAIVVLTVILALGVPSFMEFIKNNRLTTQANNLVVATQLARNEAIKRGTGTAICAANADLDGCSTATNWATGWIVFIDRDQDADLSEVEVCTTAAEFDTKDCILRTDDPLSRNTLTADKNHLHFRPNGLTSNGPITFTLKADDCQHQQQRSIIITLQGHPISTKQNCS
jgi:prepilin-type N-terminal cleavage/methylation domain-containing protein